MKRLRSVRPTFRPSPAQAWPLAVALLVAATGCFRATGIQRSILAAEEIPAIGGDRPAGNKAAAGPGDYYIGNDFIELAVDGTPFGERDAIAGAAGGGSVVDIGYLQFDTSFRRVSMPADSLERLTPLVNQDPDLQLVFDSYQPTVANDTAIIAATGGLYDPKHKLAGAQWDSRDRVIGVTAQHQVTLSLQGRFFTLTTTISNNSAATLPILNIGDGLFQRGGGYRPVIPAQKDANGAPISTWGVTIPGSDFSQPLATSVQAPMVGLMAAEPAGATVDAHATLGFLPVDADQFFVASDPQDALDQDRPIFPQHVVIGGQPGSGIPAGQSLTHNRRLYVIGGTTNSADLPSQTTGVMNVMEVDRSQLRPFDTGILRFRTFGSAIQGGPLQTEIRVERNVGSDASPVWQLERAEWREPLENIPGLLSPVTFVDSLGLYLPVGTYRVLARNRFQESIIAAATNTANTDRPDIALPLVIEKDLVFAMSESVSPERSEVVTSQGVTTGNLFTSHYFTAIGQDQVSGHLQPLRFTLLGTNGTPDPDLQRSRSLGGIYDAVSKGKIETAVNVGAYRFKAGNQIFGASFMDSVPEVVYFRPGTYLAYATRGPLGILDSQPIEAFDGQSQISHNFIVFPETVPAGWTSFDLPGPSQATTGGLLPGEKLASALADQVQVVADTELDLNPDAVGLYNDFRQEFLLPSITDASRTTVGLEPFVLSARSSDLGTFGAVTALAVPAPTPDVRSGARSSRTWVLADFMTQAEGAYTVVHRPRGPKGLFTQKSFSPTVALGTGVNAWWNGQGNESLGRTNGSFDALELLRADGFDPANPGAWFDEFKQVRTDWFAILNQQTPASFTKGLGLSSAMYSLDTTVGMARTYLKTGASVLSETDLSGVLGALKSGAAVASTGPLLDATIGDVGPGGLVAGPVSAVTLNITITAGPWVPVDELRVVVNGQVVQTLPAATTLNWIDSRTRSGSIPVNLPGAKDAWIVVEAGVGLNTTGPYAAGTPWARIFKGIYPIAVTNPIFVDVNGGGYVAPGL